jgi:hypothetical protein
VFSKSLLEDVVEAADLFLKAISDQLPQPQSKKRNVE